MIIVFLQEYLVNVMSRRWRDVFTCGKQICSLNVYLPASRFNVDREERRETKKEAKESSEKKKKKKEEEEEKEKGGWTDKDTRVPLLFRLSTLNRITTIRRIDHLYSSIMSRHAQHIHLSFPLYRNRRRVLMSDKRNRAHCWTMLLETN